MSNDRGSTVTGARQDRDRIFVQDERHDPAPVRHLHPMKQEVVVFADGFVFPEAPIWFGNGVWVSDIVAGGVSELHPSGRRVHHHLPDRRGIGGMAVTDTGRLIASGRDLVDVLSEATVLSRPDGATGLNDLGVAQDGDLLVGVLNYRPLAGEAPVAGSVGRVSSDAVDWTWMTDVTWPNGIGTLSDGAIVIADFAEGVLRSVEQSTADRDAAGIASRVTARSQSGHFDGMCVDVADHVWVATGPGGSLVRLDRAGQLVEHVTLPADFVSSACFSGDDPHRLFVTVAGCSLVGDQGGAVLTFEVETPGATPVLARLTPR